MILFFLSSVFCANPDPEIGFYDYDYLEQGSELPIYQIQFEQKSDQQLTIPASSISSTLQNYGLDATQANSFQNAMQWASQKRLFFHSFRYSWYKLYRSGQMDYMQKQYHKTQVFVNALKNSDGTVTMNMRLVGAKAPSKIFNCGAVRSYGSRAYCFPTAVLQGGAEDRRSPDEMHSWIQGEVNPKFTGLY
ncbi:hypothetical protein TRFO_42124 [Tritrichomonas foetus]|uniref:Uncharacterized protein n=1 Tax=Tritrichomonas foetus TaxID=1144522 RepID=A0A1J4KXM4_9EUKA|nr:hypothetical protein TRFO_42124 [Tritrichomonas foetus]|eukprot:OHT16001.1 hypothetical protein TRFO_42124 [Tritrichomonas foetus]